MRNCDVVAAWQCGEVAASGHMHTDGLKLWSYSLVIGRTIAHHTLYTQKVAYSYTAPFNFVSMTTSCHVGLAKQVADRVETPAGEW